MPVFTFEKISPPVRRSPAAETESEKKPRGVIIQLLDRIVEGRARRLKHHDSVIARNERFPTK
jgi:hypothetical protein